MNRIFVNKEITELIYGLIKAYDILPVGGVIAVVTFHSIEDKIVKFFFKEYSEVKNSSRYLPKSISTKKYFNLTKKKPIIPSSSEININPPSRSAKLRYTTRSAEPFFYPESLKKKFEKYLKIEEFYV